MRIKQMYENVTLGKNVIYKEGSFMDNCIVRDIKIVKDMKIFHLVSSTNGMKFKVSISVDAENAAYCPWYFLTEDETN
jgi:hypothetical protein